jgi:hypothetical protein
LFDARDHRPDGDFHALEERLATISDVYFAASVLA